MGRVFLHEAQGVQLDLEVADRIVPAMMEVIILHPSHFLICQQAHDVSVPSGFVRRVRHSLV